MCLGIKVLLLCACEAHYAAMKVPGAPDMPVCMEVLLLHASLKLWEASGVAKKRLLVVGSPDLANGTDCALCSLTVKLGTDVFTHMKVLLLHASLKPNEASVVATGGPLVTDCLGLADGTGCALQHDHTMISDLSSKLPRSELHATHIQLQATQIELHATQIVLRLTFSSYPDCAPQATQIVLQATQIVLQATHTGILAHRLCSA